MDLVHQLLLAQSSKFVLLSRFLGLLVEVDSPVKSPEVVASEIADLPLELDLCKVLWD